MVFLLKKKPVNVQECEKTTISGKSLDRVISSNPELTPRPKPLAKTKKVILKKNRIKKVLTNLNMLIVWLSPTSTD